MKILEFGSHTDIGRVREENQDSYGKFSQDTFDLASPKGQLFIVADGMGGHRGGLQASRLTVEAIQQAYFDSGEDIAESLALAFRAANQRVYSEGNENPALSGMGTTCSALVLSADRGCIAHVGDSRIYRVTQKDIIQLTQDHSTVAELERKGLITRQEARYHPDRSVLYRALGTGPDVEVDLIRDIAIDTDDWFVLCTDGLCNKVNDDEVRNIVLQHTPAEACVLLTGLANERGGQDNITILVVRARDVTQL